MRRKPISLGKIELDQPLMTASGTAGYGAEFADYLPLRSLGAVVTKSVAHFEWPGNRAPRLQPTTAGMLNSVGLQGSGVDQFIDHDLPALERVGAKIVPSVWGHSVDDYRLVTARLAEVADRIAAIEVNLSCPNLGGDHTMFAHDAELAAQIIEQCEKFGVPLWAKLSPNTDRLVEIARRVTSAGSQALTLINTVFGMAIDTNTGRPSLGNGRGGLSGPAIRPIAVRCIYDVRAALPEAKIIGVGGVVDAESAFELMMAGADAVQVGTATFADPKALSKILAELNRWADARGISDWSQVTAAAHRV
ncbi:MAG: dihydroorotate dehydrogenase [Actinomycetota bacterium]